MFIYGKIRNRNMKIIKLRPHHLLDIVSDYGHGVKFEPHPYGHAVHTVAQMVLSNAGLKAEFIVGADEICRPCKHLQPDGQCDDVMPNLEPPSSKQKYNDDLDRQLFNYLDFTPGTIVTIRQFLETLNEKVPGIEKICTHPGEDQKARLDGLKQGLFKLGIRSSSI